ncbi:MAG: sugar phosphate isomerase/epimerase [Planctomycetales bacterium]|nr:sugar phosphate isomerase/epimerase [Planctomycetales bacterium]
MSSSNQDVSRREFTFTALAAFGGAALTAATPWLGSSVAAAPAGSKNRYCAFIKFLQSLSYDELAEKIAELGFGGVEATVRSADGYIKPESAAVELPKFKRALEKRGLEITILTTDILQIDQPHVESTLQTAAENGVPRYRLGFWRYDLKQPIEPQLAAIQPQCNALAALNRRLGISAVYQNHCGANFVGSTIWDLQRLLANIPPAEIGCVYDLRHAMVEAGEAWPMLHELIKPHITAYSVKDYVWKKGKSSHVPLGDGLVSRKFYEDLAASDFAGPISVHVEYLKQGDAAEQLAALDHDFGLLRKWMGS